MVNHNVNTLTICRDNYENQEDFENAIKKAVMVLLENECILTIQDEEPCFGIVVIQYETAHVDWGCHYPYWLLPEEIEQVNVNGEED